MAPRLRGAVALGQSLVAVVLVVTAASPAHAHGRPTAFVSLVAVPGDPTTLVAQTTWGLALSDDAGARWRWLCAASYGVDARREDPPIALTASRALLVATFAGLRRADALPPCDLDAPDARLDGAWIDDVTTSGDGSVAWAVRLDTTGDDVLYRSDDGGRTWAERYREPTVLIERVRVAPGDARVVYLSGAIPLGPGVTERRAFVLRSDDGGESFETNELPLEDGERSVLVTGVSPADPLRVFAQVLHFNGELAPERTIVSDDGGRTFRTVVRASDTRAFAASPDGSRVWVGSTHEGIWRSEDGGDTFRHVDREIYARCLAWIDGALFVCGDPALDGWALGRSLDGGDTIEPVVRLPEVAEMATCPPCSRAAWECPAWAPDVAWDLGVPDAAVPPVLDADGGTGAPRDAGGPPAECPGASLDAGTPRGASGGGCGCAHVAPRNEGAWYLCCAAISLRAARRARRRGA